MKSIQLIPWPFGHPICIAQKAPGEITEDKDQVVRSQWLYATHFSPSAGTNVEVQVMDTLQGTKVQSALCGSLTAMSSFSQNFSWARTDFTEYSTLIPSVD